jgi:uncharacterized protein YfaS (alpha-2-macroglobulin family)
MAAVVKVKLFFKRYLTVIVGLVCLTACRAPREIGPKIPPEPLILDDPAQVGLEYTGDTDVYLFKPFQEEGISAVMVEAEPSAALLGFEPKSLGQPLSDAADSSPPHLLSMCPDEENLLCDAAHVSLKKPRQHSISQTRATQLVSLKFDRRIHPDAIAPYTALMCSGVTVPFHVASKQDVDSDDAARELFAHGEQGTFLFIMPDGPLPKNTECRVRIEAGAPSFDGKSNSLEPQEMDRISTPRAFIISPSDCGQAGSPCRIGYDYRASIELSSALSEASVEPDRFVISPKPANPMVVARENRIEISGGFEPGTTYQITVPKTLRDESGQLLQGPRDVRFKTEPQEDIQKSIRAASYLDGVDSALISIDPDETRSFEVSTEGFDRIAVEIHRVTIGNWPSWAAWRKPFWIPHEKRGPLPGDQIFKGDLTVKTIPGEPTVTAVDFSPYLEDGHGQFILLINAHTKENRTLSGAAWVQFTSLALTAVESLQTLRILVNRPKDAEPAAGVKVSLEPGSGVSGFTANDGFVELKLPWGPASKALLIACQTEDDMLLVPKETDSNSRLPGFKAFAEPDDVAWYVVRDRPQYRPGESVHIKGRLMAMRTKGGPRILPLPKLPKAIAWQGLFDNETTAEGNAAVNPTGGFDLSFVTPKPNDSFPHFLSIALKAEGHKDRFGTDAEYRESFLVGIPETPTSKVTLRMERFAPFISGELVQAALLVRNADNSPHPGADVRWIAEVRPTAFVPKGRSDYTFGPIAPVRERDSFSHLDRSLPSVGGVIGSIRKTIDQNGYSGVGIRFSQIAPSRPVEVELIATAAIPGESQEIEETRKIVVHPAALYVGLRTPRLSVQKNEKIPLDVLAVNLDGAAVKNVKVSVRFFRIESRNEGCTLVETKTDEQECEVVSDTTATKCFFVPKKGGEYQIEALLKDRVGRENRTELRVWVTGKRDDISSVAWGNGLGLLVPMRKEVEANQTMSLLVRSPFYPAEGLLTVRSQDDVLHTERFSLRNGPEELRLKVPESVLPELWAHVDLVGSGQSCTADSNAAICDNKLPSAYASSELSFMVQSPKTRLHIKIASKLKADGAEKKSIVELTLTDAAGAPVGGADVTVLVVEDDMSQSTLNETVGPNGSTAEFLASHTGIRDVTEALTNHAGSTVRYLHSSDFLRHSISRRAVSPGFVSSCYPSLDLTDKGFRIGPPPSGRTVAFVPSLITDDLGRATVELLLPDEGKPYRIVAVASDGVRFGIVE